MGDPENKLESKAELGAGLVSDLGASLESMNTAQRRRRKLTRKSDAPRSRTVTHPIIVPTPDDPTLAVSVAYSSVARAAAVPAPAAAEQSNPEGIAQAAPFGDGEDRTMEIDLSQVQVSAPRTSTFSLAEEDYEEMEETSGPVEVADDEPEPGPLSLEPGPPASANIAAPPAPPAFSRAPTNPGTSIPTPPPTPPSRPPPAPKRPEGRTAALAAAATADTKGRKKPHSKPWFEEVFEEDYLRTLPFLTPQATQAEAIFILQSLGLEPGAHVLDVGAGYGRHALELAARGMNVVAFDLSLPLLLRGADEAERRGLSVQFVQGDMRELDFDAQFDGVYCWFSTFGYFDDDHNRKTAVNLCRALKPGGRLVIEVLNRDYIISDLPTRVWWEGDGCVVLEEVEFNYFTSRLQSSRSVVFDDGRQLEQELSIRAYSLHELGKLLYAAGFKVTDVSGNLATPGRFLGPLSRHLIVVAEKRADAA